MKKFKLFVLGAATLALLLLQIACSSSTTVSAPQSSGIVPVTPGNALLFSVLGEQARTVNGMAIEISVKFDEPFGIYDFGGTRRIYSGSNGLFSFEPPPSNTPATMFFRVVTLAGGVSDTLAINSIEYWEAIVATEADFVGVHQFDFSKTGQTTNLKLIVVNIRPGSGLNSINLSSDGFISVAILATPSFDPASLNRSSLTLEGAAARIKSRSSNIGTFDDVDGDGDLDLVVQFPTADLELTEADTEAVLEATTLDGVLIQGVDAIIVVP